MAFFNDLGKRIQETGQGVMRKTKDTAEVIRLNTVIAEEEKRVRSLYEKLGKAYLELHADSVEETLSGFVGDIKEAEKKVNDYREEVKRLKGYTDCPNCGKSVEYGAPFCSSCGNRMASSAGAPAVNGTYCTQCGCPVSEGSAFCTQCGTKVNAAAQPTPAQPNADQPSRPLMRYCPACGKTAAGENQFCIRCGTKIDG